jgi:hypothetical protein
MTTETIETALDLSYQFDVGGPTFVDTVRAVFPEMSKQEVLRIGWKAKTAEEFLKIKEGADWWRDSENAPIITVEVPAMNATTFASLYKVTREMRVAGCEVRTTEEIFRRMLVVWAAQNNITVDDYMLSHDDAAAYLIHTRKT